MYENRELPIALFNGTVATTNGLYRITDISKEEAQKLIEKHGFESAIGHSATAEILAELFDKQIEMRRIQYRQKVGQKAVAFKLNERPPEGEVLIREELERCGYSLKLMERLE